MRPNTQISFVADGPITRVHVIAFDMQHSDPQRPIYQLAYDSGVPMPAGLVDLPGYLERLAYQLRAKIAVEAAETRQERRPDVRPFLS
jgi:hypothetical protein